MKIDDLIGCWNEIRNHGVYQGYDAYHIVDLYFGMDTEGNRDFVILTSTIPPKLPQSSKSIKLYRTLRDDGKHAIHFQLIQQSDNDVFIRLCHDLAESSRNCTTESEGINRLLSRYIKWKKLLDRSGKGQLSSIEIKGLLGELLFMEKYLFKRYGFSITIDAWVGPLGADRDFAYADSWYEVKAIDPGALTVLISSVDQLDTDDEGHLVLVTLEKTSTVDIHGITLSETITHIKELIALEPAAATIFDSKLADAGCLDYMPDDEDRYVIHKITQYVVSNSFPRIRRRDLVKGIVKVEYHLSVDSLTEYRISNME